MSVLMDSCSVMRSSKISFEIKLHESVAPAVIDMDGDLCHHIHNACKKFTKVFEKYLEQLYQDIYNDFTWSEDIPVILEDICACLITYPRSEMFVATRWLLVYDVTLSNICMFDLYAVFYFSYLRKSMLNTICFHHKLSDEVKTGIGAHQNELKWKKLTKAEKERKDRIVQKVIADEKKRCLYMSIYSSALQVMRKYVKIFQQAEPTIFRIHTEQVDVFTEFSTNFIKAVVLSERNSIRKLKTINFGSTENHLLNNLLSVGLIAHKIVKNPSEDDKTVCEFLNKAITAYSKCAAYMVEKLPRSNDFLKTVTAIDPVAIIAKRTVIAILHLPDIVTNVLSSTDLEDCEKGM